MKIAPFTFFYLCMCLLPASPTLGATLQSGNTFGVYWGTFDPPTRAHQQIITQSFSTGIDRLFIVINNHGHKNYKARIEDRIAMLEKIIPPTLPITLLIQDKAHTWGMDDLKNNFGEYPKVSWHIFSGQENLAYWDPEDGDVHDKVFIIPRGNTGAVIPESVTIMPLIKDYNFVSSTAVRSNIKNQDINWQTYVPDQVAQYISQRSLYE